jgi:hypothetical protein
MVNLNFFSKNDNAIIKRWHICVFIHLGCTLLLMPLLSVIISCYLFHLQCCELLHFWNGSQYTRLDTLALKYDTLTVTPQGHICMILFRFILLYCIAKYIPYYEILPGSIDYYIS